MFDGLDHWREVLSARGTCPQCGCGRVWHNGLRWRKASLRVEGRTVYCACVPVRRLRCGDCRHRWSRAPDEVSSSAHFQPCVVGEAVMRDALSACRRDEVAREHGCHRRTIGRWIARLAAIVPGRLGAQLATSPVVLPRPPVTSPRRGRMGALVARAVEVIVLLEALVAAHGLTPPALAHLARFVPADAPPAAPPRRRDSPR